jgi:hypothetical protein
MLLDKGTKVVLVTDGGFRACYPGMTGIVINVDHNGTSDVYDVYIEEIDDTRSFYPSEIEVYVEPEPLDVFTDCQKDQIKFEVMHVSDGPNLYLSMTQRQPMHYRFSNAESIRLRDHLISLFPIEEQGVVESEIVLAPEFVVAADQFVIDKENQQVYLNGGNITINCTGSVVINNA